MAIVQCARCGYEWDIKSPRGTELFCYSCRARKTQTVHGPLGKCLPWHGAFMPNSDTPIDDDGKVVMPGVRLCGKSDCVSPRHVIPYERKHNGDRS